MCSCSAWVVCACEETLAQPLGSGHFSKLCFIVSGASNRRDVGLEGLCLLVGPGQSRLAAGREREAFLFSHSLAHLLGD